MVFAYAKLGCGNWGIESVLIIITFKQTGDMKSIAPRKTLRNPCDAESDDSPKSATCLLVPPYAASYPPAASPTRRLMPIARKMWSRFSR